MAYNRFSMALLVAAILTFAGSGCATDTGSAGGAQASDACPADIKGNECA